MEPQRTARYYYLRFLRIKGDPHSLARGVAIGMGVGILPIVPLQTLIILIITPLLRGNSIVSIIAGLLVSNPLTMVLQYYASWKIGNLVYPVDLTWNRIKQTLEFALSGSNSASLGERLTAFGQLGFESLAVMVLGGMILAVPLVLVSYPLALRLFLTFHRKRQQKHILS